jgi:hypothetical protein
MSIPAMPYKTSDELLDYKIDMTAELAGRLANGADDTITAVVWTIPTGLTKQTSAFTDSTVTVWLTGGTLGTTYEVAAQMTTTGGRVYHRSFRLAIKDR